MDVEKYVHKLMDGAKSAGIRLASMDARSRDALLIRMADLLEQGAAGIAKSNESDVVRSRGRMSQSELDRLLLPPDRIRSIAADVRSVAALPDPLSGEEEWRVPSGLRIRKVRVPFGVIGTIYENRPNVTIDIASLCLKSGNACILRGSASALESNRALVSAIVPALQEAGLAGAVALVDTPDRAAVDAMMKARGRLDLLIPRGGAGLIQRTIENSTVPVIETGTGNCHVFVDESADLDMAERIVINSKTQRPSVCNAEEKLLVHAAVAGRFVPRIAAALQAKGVEIRGCPEAMALAPGIKAAAEEDWPKEYLDMIIAVKVVPDLAAAITHINRYNSRHTDAIVTNERANAERFEREVDAAAVMVNASTRFTDGGQFGFGAEVGISTQKLHARGPMGLRELTTYKYLVEGEGQTRQ